MTQDEIIEMAIQAWKDSGEGWVVKDWFNDRVKAFEAFAHLVAAKEREACAKEADEYATYGGSNFYDSFKKLAAIIRARSGDKS